LGDSINTTYWESQVSIASDGNTLYFSSDRSGGYGGKDIYKIVKDSMGRWSSPINLGAVINTAEDEKSPFIHVDDQTLYFSSQGHLGLGGFDIFISRKDKKENWSKPLNIGYPINSDADDLGFFVSTDGNKGYFASNKLDGVGGWDIYGFDLYRKARPRKVLFLKGELKDEDGKVISGATVELKNLNTYQIDKIKVNNITGKYVIAKAFDSTDYMLSIQKEDHFYNSLYISHEDKTFSSPKNADFTMQPLDVGASFVINKIFFEKDNVLFDTDSYELKPRSRAELDNLVSFLKLNYSVSIAIHGHTDALGNDQDNLALSNNRARVVYEYLIKKEIEGWRLSYKGFGKGRPIASNATKEGRAQNRRTEVIILDK